MTGQFSLVVSSAEIRDLMERKHEAAAACTSALADPNIPHPSAENLYKMRDKSVQRAIQLQSILARDGIAVTSAASVGTVSVDNDSGSTAPGDADVKASNRDADFKRELTCLLNRYSMESGPNLPDFVLAEHLIQCIGQLRVLRMARSTYDMNALGSRLDIHPRSAALEGLGPMV